MTPPQQASQSNLQQPFNFSLLKFYADSISMYDGMKSLSKYLYLPVTS